MSFFEVNKIPLRVIMQDGVDVTGGTQITETKMLQDTTTNNAPTFYFNTGFTGVEFEVSIIVKASYFYEGKHISKFLNGWDKWNTVVSVVTDALDIPNSKYVLRIKSKNQSRDGVSIWKLRFKQYYENEQTFENGDIKTSSLSAISQTLLKYTKIDKNSPKEAILALQKALENHGCWMWIAHENKPPYNAIIENGEFKERTPNGIWDWEMEKDIFMFQTMNGLSEKKQGKCDLETIQALVASEDIDGYRYQQGYNRGIF